MKKIRTDLLIIGAGPAGLGAALYAVRAATDFKIIDKLMAGGQITTTEYIENYLGFKDTISGFDLMQNMVEHCRKFDIKIGEYLEINSISKIKSDSGKTNFICIASDDSIESKALIIATGASPRRLFVEGESEYIGKGISFCATCDGALYRGKEVAVIGGGNTALQEALFLTKFAEKVYIIHRRDELRAVKILQKRAFENAKIEFLWNSVIDKFAGSSHLEEISILDLKNNKKSIKKVDGVFEYVGIIPNNELVRDVVKLDENGFIITNEKMQTSAKGIFAAGDVRNTMLRQVITAVADGAVAATYADKYLSDLC
ncbi:MAG: thioredoxin-disulfide reductase [Actinobacteria bacterium]|nr:thioredoxin-disulfide reductase [Actinomycetota bacterium]